ncbi:MAG: phosphoglucomutase/phosphomannomutase family protein [Candidatus Kapabacteria bacterium]|nr:phosphoglucomutase/phosphomannomutase family protein [Candidatus Kapabacteria bacterium]MDW8011685.1 phosphoglucomutase/phosphomannomutase family protein [Bacteroidota bacterium]
MIRFGTDGWRGVIAYDFTVDNLRLVSLATARYIHSLGLRYPAVVVGYDTRFLSREFAHEVACVLASENIVVHLMETFAPTPLVSFHTKQKGAALGIVITASHNPAKYNGYKIRGNFGGPATPEQVAEVEQFVAQVFQNPPRRWKLKSLEQYIEDNLVRPFDPRESYVRHIRKKIALELIQRSNLRILHDPMYGAGIGLLRSILPQVEELHSELNPIFGEVEQPEPIPERLRATMEYVRRAGRYDVCIVTDGDADRVAAIDHEGNYVDSQRLFMLLLKYLYEDKKRSGIVAKTVSVTSMVDLYCQRHEIPLVVTPVGFKHIARLMQEERVLLGGEESGGFATVIHIPERDGIFCGLLLLEMMARRQKSLKQLSQELDEEFGPHRYRRLDVHVSEREKAGILKACAKQPARLGRYPVERIDTTDGFKFFVPKGWLLIRPSGTEPLVRYYAEGDSLSMVNELLEEARKLR